VKKASRVVFVGQFPPPINGLTFITSRLASALEEAGYEIAAVNTAVPTRRRSILFHMSRVAKVVRAMTLIASDALSGKSRVCYFTAEGGFGLVYSVIIASCARLCRFRIYIHHHSFSYIVRPNRLMKLLLSCSGEKAVHICLSAGMAQELAHRYGLQIKSLILSNAAFVAPTQMGLRSVNREYLAIGLLSNLNSKKGLYEFLDVVRIAKQRQLPIRGVLAGPVNLEKDRALLESTKKELGEYLEYRGAVYNEEKSRFFHDIDVLVFLTTYLNEAQPTVLFEAMAHGIPVVSCDRGCIRSQVGDAGFVFSQGANFVPDTLEALQTYCNDPDKLAAHRQTAFRRFEVEWHRGKNLVAKLFDEETIEDQFYNRQTLDLN
jgi:glycosyltransferase involved in cell wall biosynthesis